MGEPTADGRERDWRAGTEVGSEGGGGGSLADLELALDGMGGLEDGAGGLLPQHVPPGLPAGRGGPEAVGGVGLAVAELREGERRRRRGEARDVRGRVPQQRRLVQRLCLVHRPQQVRGCVNYLHSSAFVQALLASEYAKGNYKQARLVLYRVLQIGGVTGLALAATLFLGFGYLTLLFTDDPAL
ncbi:MATE efflux family protein 2, chloroplastic [Hordeum vulgare]|nr:MATE efflux family protein 2, chloroplastic [Hordeum vulgare]